MVRHLEEDLLYEGQLMFSDGSAIKTANKETVFTVAGSALDTGYINGEGFAARFDWISSFVQISTTQAVVVDCNNHCFRMLYRDPNNGKANVSDYVGSCHYFGSVDGPDRKASFYYPISILPMKSDSNKLLVTERTNGIRVVNIKTKHVTTLIRSSPIHELYLPTGMNWLSRSTLLLSGPSQILSLELPRFTTKIISGGKEVGYRDGPLTEAMYSYPKDIVTLFDKKLVLVAD